MTKSGFHSPSAHTYHAEDGPAGQWQPIAAAPTDGTWIIFAGGTPDHSYDEYSGRTPPMVIGFWCAPSDAWRFASYDSGFYGTWDNPTHWMPLPDDHLASPDGREGESGVSHNHSTSPGVAARMKDGGHLTTPTASPAGHARQRMNNNPAGEGS